MRKHFLNPPNWFTGAGLFCGMYAIILATGIQGEQNFYKAASMILFAAVFDLLDGRVARITKTGSAFGTQLDSLVDMVSFGLAPAILLYAWGMEALGSLGLVGAFVFALCVSFRLARFNIEVADKQDEFVSGLTCTMAGSTIAAAVMTHAKLHGGGEAYEHPMYVWLITLVLSVLMVSNVPYRTHKTMFRERRTHMLLAFCLGCLLVAAVRFNVQSGFLALLAPYVASGPLEALLFRRRAPVGTGDDLLDVDDEIEDEDEDWSVR
jgi:CDP-diacylglycerol---serine O-phosphatidyltransferase